MKNLGIGARLALGFLAVLLLTLAIVGIGALQTARVFDILDYYVTNTTPSLTAVRGWNRQADEIRLLQARHLMSQSIEEKDALEADIRQGDEKLQKLLADYEPLLSNDEDKRLWQATKVAAQAFLGGWDQLKVLSRQSVTDPAKLVQAEKLYLRASEQEFRALLAAIVGEWEFNTGLADTLAQQGRSTYHTALVVMATACVLALLTGVVVAWRITSSITGPIRQSVRIAQRVAAGDLSGHIEVKGRDETGQLLQALKDMNDALANIVGEVRAGATTISSASQQIASGNADLSARTEEQASSLEETASSMEEMTSTVRQNAGSSRQANQLAQEAAAVAAKGGAVMGQVVGTMAAINESSKKVVDIIGLIDGIAFQTNILALNAAVEAARAGEQGRGFAVVAAEVRTLAQRSAQAAKEIKVLIDDSVRKAGAGSALVEQAGATAQELAESIRRVTDLMGGISAASQEQTAGIEQINQALTQMDQVTQQNASLVEEVAAASEGLREEAIRLAQVVGVFKLDRFDAANPLRVMADGQPAERRPLVPVAAKPSRPLVAHLSASAQ